VSQCYDILGR